MRGPPAWSGVLCSCWAFLLGRACCAGAGPPSLVGRAPLLLAPPPCFGVLVLGPSPWTGVLCYCWIRRYRPVCCAGAGFLFTAGRTVLLLALASWVALWCLCALCDTFSHQQSDLKSLTQGLCQTHNHWSCIPVQCSVVLFLQPYLLTRYVQFLSMPAAGSCSLWEHQVAGGWHLVSGVPVSNIRISMCDTCCPPPCGLFLVSRGACWYGMHRSG